MKPNSAPGLDGFTVAWVRHFWDELADLCVSAVNNCYEQEELTRLLKTAIMRLLRKGEKCRLEATNYRPISLLSVFYKMASGVITRRLETVMEGVIGRQQKAYSSERNIGSVLINLLNMMQLSKQRRMANLILCIDFKKAFDSIDHTFINSTLKILNFGTSFRKWVLLFFQKRETYLLLQGHMEEKIHLEQGVPQGDILSPYIFNICVEILLLKITMTNKLEGVTFAKVESRCEAYADDTTIVIKRTEENLRNLVTIIKDFANISGLHANLEKTHVIPIGAITSTAPEDQLCKDLKLNWTNTFTLLGFDIDSELNHLNENFEKRFLKVQSLIIKWERRNLTTSGRVAIAKAILLSQFVYFLQILDVHGNDICERIEHLLQGYIKGKSTRNWVSSNEINTSHSLGGLGFFNIKKFTHALNASFVLRYVRKTDDHWCDKIDQSLKLTPETRHRILDWGDLKFTGLIKEKLICIGGFFTAWQEICKAFPSEPSERNNSWVCQPLFHNSNVKSNIPSNNRAGFKVQPLEVRHFGLPYNSNIKIIDVYSACRLKTMEQLEELVHRDEEEADFRMAEGSYLRLKRAMKFVTGMQERCEGVPLSFPMTIPALDSKPLKYSSSSLRTFTGKIKKGSQKFRAVLTRHADFIDEPKLDAWKATLQSEHITRTQLRNAFKLTTWKHYDAELKDKLLRLLTKKTTFNSQVERAYPGQKPHWYTDPYCHTCKTEKNVNIRETFYHAVAECDYVRESLSYCMNALGLASFSPLDSTTLHSVLWSFDDRVLGPCQPLINKLTLSNAIRWIIMLEILNFRREKLKPDAILVLVNVKKNLCKLARKSKKIPILREFQIRASLEFNQLLRPPENPYAHALPQLTSPKIWRAQYMPLIIS